MPLEEALARILSSVTAQPETESIALVQALNRVLADDVASAIDVPGEDNSAMDGYALRAADAPGPLPISQRIAAGAAGQSLAPGSAARIFTGAAMPPGADTVVMQENCRERDGKLEIQGEVRPGQNIRPRAQDVGAGDVVLETGRRLRPQDLGLLASVGCSEVKVYRPLKVAVLSTGDELVEPGAAELTPGKLYNSNRFTLAGLIARLGMEFVDCGIVPDDPDATRNALQRAADQADCVITSGGVSVGEEDHVKQQVDNLGHLDLWKLAMKPGKPLMFGTRGQQIVLGLPGNPVSALVTARLFLKPLLAGFCGQSECHDDARALTLTTALRPNGPRQDYIRATIAGDQVTPLAVQDSAQLSAIARADGLIIRPPQADAAEIGDHVPVLLLRA